ncbi:hypothetical protein INT44_007095 [Umbelopsis vinacea]|uniref:RING-type E3 ubiquitin transferase n=1 Tax=Umbelopsis vinacea TaxID=44442 RepID=A0A8H7PGF8_9FUNG|nr:hypothetical protein INT44_007095 [Umbelopsis vinacea]KAI9276207.1 hypothetical protein BC943DRAFT_384050 [Umbelopsis sp. AD052]
MDTSKQQKPVPEEEEDEGELCFICTEPVATFAVSECNHRTCHICSLRLRALYKTRNCAYCKTEQKKVVFTKDPVKLFQDYTKADTPLIDKHLNIRFEDQQIFQDSMILLQFNCPEPSCEVACAGGWPELKRHVKKEHDLLLCDLCTRFKKIFTHEHTLFSSTQLTKHYKFGDKAINKDDDSGFTGHPECAFCKSSFYGDDELFEHCRDKHEQCHICVRNGLRHQYYANYDQMAKHFHKDHYMCQWRDCLDKKFIVFDSDLDLKAHEVEVHGSSAGRVQRARQLEARKVDVNFEYSGGPSRGGDRNRRDNTRESSQNESTKSTQSTAASKASEEFPAIGSETNRMQQLSLQTPKRAEGKDKKQNNQAKSKGIKKPEGFGSLSRSDDWPGLGQAPTSSAQQASSTAAINAPAETIEKHSALLEKLSLYVNGDQRKMERFRQITSAYRNSTMDGKSYIDQLFEMLNLDVDQTARIIRGVEELLDNTSKKTEIIRYWRDKRTSLDNFPSLSPIGAAQRTNASNPAKRVLVIKSGNTKRGGTKTKTSKANVWDKVAHAASSTPVATRQVTPPSSRPHSPARNVTMTKTPWSISGSSAPVNRRAPSPTPAVRRTENEFPSLPTAPPKHQLIVDMRRTLSSGDIASRGWGQDSSSNDDAPENNDPLPNGKKSKKKGKQVLFRVGL